MVLFAPALIDALIALNVQQVFGVSGYNIDHIHNAIHHRCEIKSILTKTEIGAAYMADAHARVHKTLAVCCATSGAAMMNTLVGIAESRAENVPVLAIIGQVTLALEGKGGFQDSSDKVNAVALAQACAKKVLKVSTLDSFWSEFADLIVSALSDEQGPVVLLLPRDCYFQLLPPRPDHWLADIHVRLAPKLPVETEIEEFITLLQQAKRPVMVMGDGVYRSKAFNAVQAFADQTGLPVATSMSGKGSYNNQAINFIGHNGLAGHASVNDSILAADFILVVGCRLDVMNCGAVLQAAKQKTLLVVVHINTPFACDRLDNFRHFQYDCGLFFSAVLTASTCPVYSYHSTYSPIEFAPFRPIQAKEPMGLTLSNAITTLNPHIKPHSYVFIDAGNTGATALHYLKLPEHSQSVIALGMGGMGYSFAAAIGVQLAQSSTAHAWVIAGDGAFLMGGLEIHCAIEHQLAILFVIFNNQGLGMCKTQQRLFFGVDQFECVEYPPVNITNIVSGLGDETQLFSKRVFSSAELQEQIIAFQNQPVKTGLIEVMLSQEEWPPFAVASKQT